MVIGVWKEEERVRKGGGAKNPSSWNSFRGPFCCYTTRNSHRFLSQLLDPAREHCRLSDLSSDVGGVSPRGEVGPCVEANELPQLGRVRSRGVVVVAVVVDPAVSEPVTGHAWKTKTKYTFLCLELVHLLEIAK